MAYAFFKIRANDDGIAAEALNRFLRSHRILTVEKEWVSAGEESFWMFCVDHLDGDTGRGQGGKARMSSSVDYKDVLPPEQFSVFAKLRDLRKEIAEDEGVPVFTLFTNKQLAEMVRNACRTRSDLQQIEGIGNARTEKYGEPFLEVLNQELPVGKEAGE